MSVESVWVSVVDPSGAETRSECFSGSVFGLGGTGMAWQKVVSELGREGGREGSSCV